MGAWSDLNYEGTRDPIIENHCFDSVQQINRMCSSKSKLKIFHANIRGIRKNFDELCLVLNELSFKFDVILLTETQLTNDELFHLPGYSCHLFNSCHSNYDGIAIFINLNSIPNASIVKESVLVNANAVRVSCNLGEERYTIIGIYRSPTTNALSLIRELDTLLPCLPPDTHQMCIGDININTLGSQKISNEYLNMLYSHGFESRINLPTRVTSTSSTCLDHIFVKSRNNVGGLAGVYRTALTDHFPVFFMWDYDLQDAQINSDVDSNVNGASCKPVTNFEKLLQVIQSEKWDELYEQTDVNLALDYFITILKKRVDECTDFKQIKNNAKTRKLKPWMTKGLLVSIRKRDNMHKRIVRLSRDIYCFGNEIETLKEKYKLYRRYLSRLINQTKWSYYKKIMQENCNNPKKFWGIINELTGRLKKNFGSIKNLINADNSATDEPKMIANAFVNYFASVGEQLASEVRPSAKPKYSGLCRSNSQCASMFLTPVSAQEVMDHILELKDGTATGIDGIKVEVIKAVRFYVAGPLSQIFNLCFQTGMYPNKFKAAIIVPIYKAGSRNKTENYRPISLLPQCSKILEKCMKSRIMGFLMQNNLISENQFGFLKNKSTDDAIYKLTTFLYNALDSSHKALAIFLDLAKAFDTVDHCILLSKMEGIGIRGLPLALFKSYLSSRTQMVRIDGEFSIPNAITLGVPQGTVLGPVLFLIYINDLCDLKISGEVLSYADDTVLLFKDLSWPLVYRRANIGLSIVYDWLNDNILTLNKSKTVYIPFCVDKKTLPPANLTVKLHSLLCDPNIDCACTSLNSVLHTKYLGITVDNHLKWSEHISETVRKTRNLLNVFYSLRRVTSLNVLLQIYKALAQSVMQYGIIGWGGANNARIAPLCIMQKRLLKTILNKPIDFPTWQVFKATAVLDIRQIYLKTVLTHLFRNSKLYPRNSDIYPLCTRSKHSTAFTITRRNKRIGQQHVNHYAPKLFNMMPSSLRSHSGSLYSFKIKLHEWIVSSGRDFFNDIT